MVGLGKAAGHELGELGGGGCVGNFFQRTIKVFSSLSGEGTEEVGLNEGRHKVPVEAVPVTHAEEFNAKGQPQLGNGDVLVDLGLLPVGASPALGGEVDSMAPGDGLQLVLEALFLGRMGLEGGRVAADRLLWLRVGVLPLASWFSMVPDSLLK